MCSLHWPAFMTVEAQIQACGRETRGEETETERERSAVVGPPGHFAAGAPGAPRVSNSSRRLPPVAERPREAETGPSPPPPPQASKEPELRTCRHGETRRRWGAARLIKKLRA